MQFAHLGRQFRTSTFRLTLVIAGLFVVCVAVLFATIDWCAMGTLQADLQTTVSARLAAIMENHAQSDEAMLIREIVKARCSSRIRVPTFFCWLLMVSVSRAMSR